MIAGLKPRVKKLERNGGGNCQCQPPLVIRGEGDMHGAEPAPVSTLCDRCGLGRALIYLVCDDNFYGTADRVRGLTAGRQAGEGQSSPPAP